MSQAMMDKTLLEKAVQWFQAQFGQVLVVPIGEQFPGYPLPGEIKAVLSGAEEVLQNIQGWPGSPIPVEQMVDNLLANIPNRLPLFKQMVFGYRRYRAAETERLTEKTFHLELAGTLEQDVKLLDAIVSEARFQKIEALRLPRLKDFLPVQYIEAATGSLLPLPPRQYDEKFHILQAPSLFLPDLAYFRAKCDDRGTAIAIAFLDIDHFKHFNTEHNETKVDRNLLPRFMQAIEAQVFHHGHAYRQGGDEYLILIPSLSRQLAIAFVDELRRNLADLEYPDIKAKTTVSIGMCVVESDCPLTDRELRDRANQAKQFAKEQGRNCIATYKGNPRLIPTQP
ncbi:MAG: GGDEF domain-containing protein [Bryobacteraceae bacterium]|nr:GGDEF domain-containing protein [Bryobacteraceae bacterium]